MTIAASCIALVSFMGAADSTGGGLPEAAKKLTLRQAFQVTVDNKKWYNDIAPAKARSVKSGLPMVLHFEAEWCGACKTMSRTVLASDKVQSQLGRRVIGVKIDADRNPHLIRQFHIAVLPSDVFLDSDGRILAQESGYRDEAAYLTSLSKAGEASSGAIQWINNPNIKLGKKALAEANDKSKCVITRRSGIVVGMGGYSPVTMTKTMGWDKGNRNYASVYQGVMYYMKDAAELREFEASPDKFAPKLHGCDPVVLSNLGTPLPGAISLGAFVEGNLYFFATEASRDLFKKNPSQFIRADMLVSGEQLEDGPGCSGS